MRRWLLLAVLMLVVSGAGAQVLPGVLSGPAQSAAPAAGSPGGSRNERACPLQAWISADVLEHEGRWKRVDEDQPLPWIAPGQRVAAYLHRGGYYDEYGHRDEVRWKIGDALAYPWYAMDYALSDALLADPVSRDWKYAGDTMRRPSEEDARELMLSPYRVLLISVEPMVAVLAPYKDPPKPRWGKGEMRRTVSSHRVAIDHEDIRYGTRFEDREGLLWLALSPRTAAAPLTFTDDVARFGAGGARFECRRGSGKVDCQRLAP